MDKQEIFVDQETTDYFHILYNENKVPFSSMTSAFLFVLPILNRHEYELYFEL